VPVPKPPLGRVRDFYKEEANALAEAKFVPVSNFPCLRLSVRLSSTHVTRLREEQGLEPISILESDVRLIEPLLYEQDIPFTDEDAKNAFGFKVNMSREGAGGGFFNPRNGLCFIRFDETADMADQYERARTAYKVAHELSHKAMKSSGVQDYPFHLNEGFADLIAKGIMRCVLPVILPWKEYVQSLAIIRSNTPLKFDGVNYEAEDLIVGLPDGRVIPYSRVPQTQLIGAIFREHPRSCSPLFRSALTGDSERARKIIERCYGLEVAQILSDEKASVKTLVDLVK